MLLLGALFSCSKTPAPLLGDASIAAPPDLAPLALAEDRRRAKDVDDALATNPDVRARRRAAQALARIADGQAEGPLLRALSDGDPVVTAWGAYGLGQSCKGKEDARVRALAARAATLESVDAGGALDARWAIARAIGKCGGPLAESTLASFVREGGPLAERAAFALGDVAGRRGTLDDVTVTALLDAAEGGLGAALYPLSRAERMNDAFSARVLEAAKKALAGPPGDSRAFAVRALARGGAEAAPELERVATSGTFGPAERADAARALGKLGEAGREAAGRALARVVPSTGDAFAVLTLSGAAYAVVVALLGALGDDPPKSAEAALWSVTKLRGPGDAPAPLARRLAVLRCTAAALLARGAWDSEVLRTCDDPGTPAWERARLASLLRTKLVGSRRVEWSRLAASKNLRVREAALEAAGAHPELGAVARTAIVVALGDFAHPGLVATAADVMRAHPERFLVLAQSEIRKGTDPSAPPPTPNPEQELAADVKKALSAALAYPFAEDLVETRLAVLEAAAALHHPDALAKARAACADPNGTVRERAAKVLRTLGETPVCAAPPSVPTAPELEKGAPSLGKLELETDAGKLTVTFDGVLAPVTSARILGLARAGLYDGVVVHRVVPGFVVQLGDPGGDGFGGGGALLRDESSPTPFAPLDVGIALAGKDTGSSQFFVTLGRFPHLDGDYPRVGHAEGDWWAVAEGDVVRKATVLE